MRFLSQEELIYLNQQTITEHGGNFVPPHNLIREGGLEFVVDIVQNEVFGQRVFQSVHEIAAAYCFYIVTGHIFQDGNKRVGLAASLIFLRLNGFQLRSPLVHVIVDEVSIPNDQTETDILFQLTIELAAGELNLEQLKSWFAENAMPRTR